MSSIPNTLPRSTNKIRRWIECILKTVFFKIKYWTRKTKSNRKWLKQETQMHLLFRSLSGRKLKLKLRNWKYSKNRHLRSSKKRILKFIALFSSLLKKESLESSLIKEEQSPSSNLKTSTPRKITVLLNTWIAVNRDLKLSLKIFILQNSDKNTTYQKNNFLK